MKIAIPLTDAHEFSPHYGASAKFAVFDVDPPQRAIRRRMIVAPPGSEPCAWPPLLRAAGVDLVLAGGMGSGARHRMGEHGVEVITGVAPAAPEALVTAWLEDRLVWGDNTCDGSGHGGHHHAAHPHEDGPCHCGH
jgi:ATP-binding protein involved in chromosome partitioning